MNIHCLKSFILLISSWSNPIC